MVLVYFMGLIKDSNKQESDRAQESNNKQSTEYVKTLKRVSLKIDKWHDQMIQMKQGTFQDDNEFVTLGNSPSRFHSSDEETEDMSETKNREDSKRREGKRKNKGLAISSINNFSLTNQTDLNSVN